MQAMSDQDSSMIAVVDRLGKLEGLIMGLQSSISQGQTTAAAFMSRVERLEQRQVELERNMVTTTHIAALTEKVDSLVASDAVRRGGTATATWTAGQLVAWVAVIISLLALVGVGMNREALHEQPSSSPQQRQP
jgi:hypothetical protein